MITQLLFTTGAELVCYFGPIIFFGLLLGILEHQTNKNILHSFGKNALLVTGIIGIPIHELSHALTAKIFCHQIKEVKFFQKPDAQGIMGYVNHSYNSKNIYQQCGNFFIGIAPIFGGSLAISLLVYCFIPDGFIIYINGLQQLITTSTPFQIIISEIIKLQFEFLTTIFTLEHFKMLPFYLFLFIAISISRHMSLSFADIKGAFQGLVIILAIFFLLNIFGLGDYMLDFKIIKYNLLISLILMLSVLFSLFSYLLSLFFKIISR
ncbi:hypothetical protein Q5O24_07585 [Eubacteriaceae bacterium ES3]|nr:hypothetical protein Q5O24_07585 [Eubacteriaceae bacterium ES3]